MDAGECAQGVSSPEVAVRLIYTLVRMFKPAQVVEIGSAFGIGTMYIAEALRANGRGAVVGVEYEDWRADIANRCLARHWREIGHVESGPAEIVLPRLAQEGKVFDFAFVDAVHKFDNTVGYHELLSRGSAGPFIAVYDDMNWSDEMRRVWRFLCDQERITDALLVNERWAIVRYGRATT
jgi:predicted O-methyltransferase YrrM